MQIDYVKQEISTEICEEGGATARIVNNQVLSLDTAVEEAINGQYVRGETTLITSEVHGIVKSMVENCAKDGNVRQIGDYITVTPTYYGLIDADTGHNPLVNGVKLNIRLLNQLKIDTSKWTFNDVTPGKLPIKVFNVSTGDAESVVSYGSSYAIKFVGYGLNSVTRVTWSVTGTTKSGSFAATSLTKTATVLTAVGGLTGLDATDSGKTIVFTVYGEKNCATTSGTLLYIEPTPSLTKAKQGSRPDNTIGFGTTLATVITGVIPGGFKAGDTLKLEGVPDDTGTYTAAMPLTDRVTSSTETSITLANGFTNSSSKPDSDWDGHAAQLSLIRSATVYPLTVNFVNE